ncbi:MAG: hypothetical protein EBR34_16255, partial [Sphingomonadaceae bacterium]|nr:hypothetical protein [Sphingomonadaceae bacterium]
EAVRVHMGALMQQGLAKDMEDAYQQAIWANPQVREKVLAEQTAAADAKRLAEAKAKAEAGRKVQAVRGAPPVSNGVQGASGNRSIRQEIEAAIAALS